MTTTVGTLYPDWKQHAERLRDAVGGLSAEQLAIRAGPDHAPIWALAAHVAGTRTYWLCGFFGEPGADRTPWPNPLGDDGWEDDESRPRSGDELRWALDSTWDVIAGCLERWRVEEIGETATRERPDGLVQVHTRASVLNRVFSHEAFHAGEISQLLGVHAVGAIDLWAKPWTPSRAVAEPDPLVAEPDPLLDLDRVMPGRVLRPDHESFDATRSIFNATIDRRPAVIVLPETTEEVAVAVRAARLAGLPIAIRGGGHGVAGHAVADDAMVIDLRRMRAVTVDPAARTARVGGGALWEDVDRATIPYDLATTGGTFWDTGVGGLTLTGGLGYLMGTAGLTCDNLVRATVVTADGKTMEAGPRGDPELLWALRGGGGNFGVVTEFEFRLHPIGGFQIGRFFAPIEQGAEALVDLGTFARQMPDEIVIFSEGPTAGPDGDAQTGPFDHLSATLVFQGTADEAEIAFAPLAASPHWRGTIEPSTYEAVQDDDLLPFGLRHYWKGHFVRELDGVAADAIVGAMASRAGSPSFMLLESMNGRARIEPSDGGSAFGQREARWNVSALAVWEHPADDEAQIAWARDAAAALAPSSYSGAGYGNYAPVDETDDRVRAGYGPERFARLRAVKRRYDPDNVFRFNLNIPPATD